MVGLRAELLARLDQPDREDGIERLAAEPVEGCPSGFDAVLALWQDAFGLLGGPGDDAQVLDEMLPPCGREQPVQSLGIDDGHPRRAVRARPRAGSHPAVTD